MSTRKNTLIGKFFIATDHGASQYRLGCIVGQLAPSSFLLQFEPVYESMENVPIPQEVCTIDEFLIPCTDCGTKLWEFFDSKEARARYLDFINEPAEKHTPPAVVHLKDHPKRKGS